MLKTLSFPLGIITFFVVSTVVFAIYGRYLLDFSLDNMDYLLNDMDLTSSGASNEVYSMVLRNFSDDMNSKSEVDLQNLTLAQNAERASADSELLLGKERTKFYVKTVSENIKGDDSWQGRLRQLYFEYYTKFLDFYNRIALYLKSRMTPDFGQQFSVSDELLLKQANNHYRLEDYAKAAEAYQKYIQLYPKDQKKGVYEILLAHSYIKLIEWQKAEELLKRVMKQHFYDRFGLVASSMMKYLKGLMKKSDEIASLLNEIERVQGTEEVFELHYRLGLSYLSLFKYKDALEHLRRASEGRENLGDGLSAMFHLASTYQELGMYQEAVKVLENVLKDAIETQPKLAIFAKIAEIYNQANLPEMANAYYKKLSDLAKKNLREDTAAQKMWIGLAEVERAVTLIKSNNVTELGDVRDRLSAMGFSVAKFMDMLENPPDLEKVDPRMRAFHKLMAGETKEAFNLFSEYFRENPKDGWTNGGLATCHLFFNESEKAMGYAEDAVFYQPDDYSTSVMGYLHGFDGNHKEAIESYSNAIAYNEYYVSAQFNISYEYLMIGDDQKAQKHLSFLVGFMEKESTSQDTRAQVYNNLGVAFWRLGNEEEAILNFKKALKIDHNNVSAINNFKNIRLGDKPEEMIKPTLLGN